MSEEADIRNAAERLTKAMKLFWEADEAADDAKRLGDTAKAERYEKMATCRWQNIPSLINALDAALAQDSEVTE